MTKTTWTTTEIKERLMKEAQAWVEGMNDILESPHRDMNAYQIYFTNAVQTLDCISILTGENYYIKADTCGKEGIYKWNN